MDLNQPLLAELALEAATTRTMLERLPGDALAWRPHPRSRPLGELAAHLAALPGLFLAHLDADGYDRQHEPSAGGTTTTVEAILAAFDRGVADGTAVLRTLSDERLLAPWTYRVYGQHVFTLPRLVVIRSTALNHLIHHRGQLSVYLRLRDVPLPSVYGPTADTG